MKTAVVSSLFFAGLAFAIPAIHQERKRDVHTDLIIETFWTTTTIYVDGATRGAFFEQASSSAHVAASASAAAAAPASSVVQSVAAQAAASSAAPVAPATGGGPSGTGDGTYYDVSVAPGSCGTQAGNDDNVVALAIPVMNNPANPNKNPMCGKTITITYGGSTFTGKVYDTCGGCNAGSIDLSPGFFKRVFPHGDGRVPGVSWVVSA
jgi:hypothetical protein